MARHTPAKLQASQQLTTPEPRGQANPGAPEQAPLSWRLTADGSPSLWSDAFSQAFHCSSGALAESRAKFIEPAQLERFQPGDRLRVVEVCVGLGYNTAALLEAANNKGLSLEWWGLEVDPRPLDLALADPRFRCLWRSSTLAALEQLRDRGHWRQRRPDCGGRVGAAAGSSSTRASAAHQASEMVRPATGLPASALELGDASESSLQPAQQEPSSGRWLLGDARLLLPSLPLELKGCCDLVLLDAFSPEQCPQLWSQEFLGQLARLLGPQGRLLTYCTAAAVRRGLELAGLRLASLRPQGPRPCVGEGAATGATVSRRRWSNGTVASPAPLAFDGRLQPLSAMEREHLLCRAAVPYRDPLGCAHPEAIRAYRKREQDQALGLLSTSAWRRRWGLAR